MRTRGITAQHTFWSIWHLRWESATFFCLVPPWINGRADRRVQLSCRAPGSALSWTWSWRSRTWALTWTPTRPGSRRSTTPKLSPRICREVWNRKKPVDRKGSPSRPFLSRHLFSFCPSCRDPGRHHPEQHAGRGGDREGARRDPEGDAGSGDQPAGSGFWLPARHSVPVHGTGQDHPGPHWEHQVRFPSVQVADSNSDLVLLVIVLCVCVFVIQDDQQRRPGGVHHYTLQRTQDRVGSCWRSDYF